METCEEFAAASIAVEQMQGLQYVAGSEGQIFDEESGQLQSFYGIEAGRCLEI